MRLNATQLQVLAGVTLIWGLNWAVMKYAVQQYPALHFRFISMLLGWCVLALVAWQQGLSLRIPRELRWRVFMLSVPNMVGWHLFCILGVQQLSSGRSAILGYTMPVWAMLAGLIWNQQAGVRGWLGLILAMVATALLLSSELQQVSGRPLGVMLMLTAAACWGLGTAMIRRFPTGLHPLVFTHATMWPALVVLGLAAWQFEGLAVGLPSQWSQWWPVLYNVFGVFVFCQVGWFFLASSLPPVVSTLSVMLIPVIGVMAGALTLGEAIKPSDWAALVLILAAMGIVLIKPQVARSASS